jgi:hypothetical protein
MATGHSHKQGNDRREGRTGQKDESLGVVLLQIGVEDDRRGKDRNENKVPQDRSAKVCADQG